MSYETTLARHAARIQAVAWNAHLRCCGTCHAAARARAWARLCDDGLAIWDARRQADAELTQSRQLDAQPITGQGELFCMDAFGYHDLERCALGFVLEAETWPVFLEWARQNHVSSASHGWLESGPDLAEIRVEWMRHSPSEQIRALADWPAERRPAAGTAK